ncbi:alpha-(1,3)-fucosyltransferase 4 [Elgaria multicarinata webbii]|uniref:alpha-(1,3)-fucosyltransferase 4 n=1 Tax=Elgaria multicarinata webbii TaxID=159646 RepID=UPI002FCD1E50
MAGRGCASGHLGRHDRGPPQEEPGAGRRRWQQHYHQPQYEDASFPVLHSAPRAPAPAAASWAALASVALGERRRRCPEEAESAPAMESAEPCLGPLRARPRPRRALWELLRQGRRCPSVARRQWRLLAAVLTCCTALALYAVSTLQPPSPTGRPMDAAGEPLVTVLLWWEPFGLSRRLGDCLRLFNVSGCRLTTDRGRLQEAHAVLFHHRDLISQGPGQIPRLRPPAQRWVWMNFESPSHTHGLRDLTGLFNWTMSYRVDSDVFVPYGYLRPSLGLERHLTLPRKTKLVAWVISNWNEEHARVRYYRQLRDYLPIDVYGAQGLELKNDNVIKTVSEYKFYLAFENSQHPDYITEKLWRNALKAWAVPVVLGPSRSNYELFVPSDSFIHIDDFSSPKQLALYLKFLDKNKSSYRRYFAWRKRYDVQVTSFWDEHCCRVCDVVKTAGKQFKTIQNLANWFESSPRGVG